MSAPLPDNPASLSNSGYEDGLGRRTLVFDRVSGTTIERLTLRPELSLFERALTARAERLAAFDDDRFARVRAIERDPVTGALTVDSDVVSGGRISDLLDAVAEGSEGSTGAGLDVAVGFLLEVLPALGALHTAAGITHGTVGPGRALLTPAGHIVLVDALFGEALQRMQFTPARLWAEFGLAMPAAAGPPRLDVAADLSQAGMTALMLALGRPIRRDEFPAGLPSAMSEVLEIAQIRGSASFASRLEQFLQQILPLASRRPYSNAKDAFNELRDFAGIELGVANCRSALATFFREAGHALEAQRMLLASAMPDTVPEPEPVALAEPEPAFEIESAPAPVSMPEPVFVVPVVEPPLQPIAPIAIEEATPPEPEPVLAVLAGPVDLLPQVDSVVPSMVEAPAAHSPATEEPAEVAELPAAASARRKRQRGPRAKRDKLRSNAAPPAPLAAPAPATPPPVVPQAPLVPPPLVVAQAQLEPPPPRPPAPPIRMPFAAAPGGAPDSASPYTSERFWEAPPSATIPVAAPVPIAAAPIPIAPKPTAPSRISVAPPTTAPLRVKAQPPAGYVPPAVHRQSRAPESSHVDDRIPFVPRESSTRRPFPWKIAAAALVVIAAGIAASQGGYLPDRGASAAPKPAAATPATAPASEPVARAVGTIVISSTPSGAKVLLDGAAAGETPLTLSDVPTGRRVVTIVSTAGTVRRTVRVVAGKSISLDVPVYSGFVNIIAPIILEVAIGGRSLGTTEQGRLLLPPGRHELTLSNRDLDYVATHPVEIESGEELRTKVEPRATVAINAIPWAEVWVDGQKAGDTPLLAKMTLLLGTHDIVFKHPQYPERRITATIKAGSPSALTVDFTKPERP